MIASISRIRTRIFEVVERPKDDSDRASRAFEISIVLLILLNVLAVVLSSFSKIWEKYSSFLNIFELVSVVIFTIEYFVRMWTARFKYPDMDSKLAIARYIISFAAIIDMTAILPFYLPLFIPIDLRFLRILRITRVLRIFKLQRYSDSIQLMGLVFRRRSKELLITVLVTFLMLLVSASAMYYMENGTQPDQFPNIIASLWWAVTTLTTVGYGDIYPVTVGGKVLAGVIALLGIGLVALPAGIVSSGFLEEMQNRKDVAKATDQLCPYCGKRIRTRTQ